MNATAVCLFVLAYVIFSQHDVAVASPALWPDRVKRFTDYEVDNEDPDMFKPMSPLIIFHARDKKDQELSVPRNVYDDSEPIIVKMYSVPIAIDQIIDPDRLNRLFGTMRAFKEKVTSSEVEDDSISDLRSEQRAIIKGLRAKKSNRFVGDAFDPSRGKRVIKYEEEWF